MMGTSASPAAHYRAVELIRSSSCQNEFWPRDGPTLVDNKVQGA
jgi:hypothetical protein